MNLIRIWKSKGQILEGVKNNIFKSEHVEDIAQGRMSICNICPFMDPAGSKCAVPGTAPCCGECGCKLSLKTRSLSSECPKGFWKAVVTEAEEDAINNSIKE